MSRLSVRELPYRVAAGPCGAAVSGGMSVVVRDEPRCAERRLSGG